MASYNEVSFDQKGYEDQDLIQLSQLQCLDQIGRKVDEVIDPTFAPKTTSFGYNEDSFHALLSIINSEDDKQAEDESFLANETKTFGNTFQCNNFGHELRNLSTACNEPSPFPKSNGPSPNPKSKKPRLVSSALKVPKRNLKAIKKTDNFIKTDSKKIEIGEKMQELPVKCPLCPKSFQTGQ